jgi:ribosomal protein S18 acetylase RimI-like enzyme
MSIIKTKKELRKEATKLANRIHRNLSNANNCDNVLASLSAFTSFDVNLSHTNQPQTVTIQLYKQPLLPEHVLNSCLDLFQVNMGSLYKQSKWGLNLREKKEELTHNKAHFLIVSADQQELAHDFVKGKPLAFAHFRFEVNDDDRPTEEVLYLYEIQIDSIAQRNGLGRRMMQMMEIVAMQMKMRKVMLTVFKKNEEALNFYDQLKYQIDKISPCQCGEIADYKIMSKIVSMGEE